MPAEHETTLSAESVRKVAALAKLELSDEQVEQHRVSLSAVLGYVARLRELDLGGVEPLVHVGELSNRFGDDVPGATLPNAALMRMAPHRSPPFIAVPKVIEG